MMSNYKLSLTQLSVLKAAHRNTKTKRDADRIKSIYLLGSGWKMSKVCEALLITRDTIRSYFSSYKRGGVKELLKNNYAGRGSELTASEQEQFSSHLEENTYSRVSEVIAYVETEFDVLYSASGMYSLLKRLGFVYKKPEKVPYKVSPKGQEAFIAQYEAIKESLSEEDSVYFMDATHPEHTPIPAYVWIKRGATKTVKSNPRPYRHNINGAINIDTLDMAVQFEKRICKETIMDFLEVLRIREPRGCIYLILDNAGYNTSPEVQQLAEAMAIKLIYLPAYSPNLNLVERVWKFFKKKVLYNKYYPEFEDMRNACRAFFSSIGCYKDELTSLMSENFQKIEMQ